MIKQFVPEEVCLGCLGCCRFKEENSVWSPCLMEEEIQGFLDKEGIPSVSISQDKRIHLIPHPKAEGFICPFLNLTENKCCIYIQRPFECQLYPFLLNLRGRKVLLTVDLHCPYLKERLNSKELKEYIGYLTDFLNQPAQLKMLKENLQVLQAYEEALEIMELKGLDEAA